MEIIFIALLIIVTVAFVAYPFFSASRVKIHAESNALETLLAQRESAYDALRDLDFDYQLGKLSEADYNSLREKYKTRAAQILQQIDAASGSNGAGAPIENQVAQGNAIETEIARRRAAKRADPIEREIAQRRATKKSQRRGELHCAKCGTPHQPNDKFCAKCGSKV